MGLHAGRNGFWDEALNGKIQVLDYAETDYPDLPSLRAAIYREAANRQLKAQAVVHNEHRLILCAFGGPSGSGKLPLTHLREVGETLTGAASDVTVLLAKGQVPLTLRKNLTPGRLLPIATELPPIEPSLSDPLYTNPGGFWQGRTWEPAALWKSPFRGDHPVGPQQCIWWPTDQLWDLEDLSWLQDRREAGTLYPWELRQGFCPPGTALSNPDGWVWQPQEWLELATERCYCTCAMRRDGSLVDPGARWHHSDPAGNASCMVWDAPDGENDLAATGPFMDPRAALVPGLMDEAEARMKEFAVAKRQNDQVRGAR